MIRASRIGWEVNLAPQRGSGCRFDVRSPILPEADQMSVQWRQGFGQHARGAGVTAVRDTTEERLIVLAVTGDSDSAGSMALLDRFRRAPQPPAACTSASRFDPSRTAPRAAGARREAPHLGGLMLEMYRRDRFREDLLAERCNELLAMDARIRELDEMLAASRRRLPAGRCECGVAASLELALLPELRPPRRRSCPCRPVPSAGTHFPPTPASAPTAAGRRATKARSRLDPSPSQSRVEETAGGAA